jgi:hypothetical protein
MKRLLDEWLDRVFYNRDATNEAQETRAKFLLTKAPEPQTRIDATFGGAIEVLGWDAGVKEIVAAKPFGVTVYVRATGPTPDSWRFEVEAQAAGPAGTPGPVRQEMVPAGGLFPTTHWRAGDLVKLEFSMKAPAWPPGPVTLQFRARDEKRQPVPVTGVAATDGKMAVLGSIPVIAAAR